MQWKRRMSWLGSKQSSHPDEESQASAPQSTAAERYGYGSDGTRTRDLRRDRPAVVTRQLRASRPPSVRLGAVFYRNSPDPTVLERTPA
jgi:hypothetical protein